jgi:hypothetical protein
LAKSAVIIGDLQLGITRNYPFAAELVARAATFAAAARERGDLVVFVRTQLRVNGADVSPRNAGVQAIFAMGDDFHQGSTSVELDPGLGYQPSDVLVSKCRASAFTGSSTEEATTLAMRRLGAEGPTPRRPTQDQYARSGRLKPIAPRNNLELTANGFLNINDRSNLEYERRKHRTEFVDSHEIVTFH